MLLLDGMEPLQSSFDFEKGKIEDQALSLLVGELAKRNSGLCVITTREHVPELDRCPGNCQQLDLEQISADAGSALLRVRGVQGSEAELEAASKAFGNHALAINLLTSYLHEIPGHHVSHAAEIPDLDIPEKEGKHPRRVIEAFAKRLGDSPELQLLYILGLFNRPAPITAIDEVKKPPVIPGLTERLQNLPEAQWLHVLERLRDYRLLAPHSHHNPDTLDCHPLIREHFSQKLKDKSQQAWKKAHERLYEYYKNLPKKELPDTLEEMEPLFAAVAHGCQAKLFQEVTDEVLVKRIRRGNENYDMKKLGAFGADLSALSNFFEEPWGKVTDNLTKQDIAFTLSDAGVQLRALGRLREAAQPMSAALDLANNKKDWKAAAIRAGNLSELQLTLGEVEAAVSSARQSVDFADRSGDDFEKLKQRGKLGNALHYAGELYEAEKLLLEAETLQKKYSPEYPYLYSLGGFLFCDLLLSQGKVREVLERAKQTLEWEIEENWLLDIALDKLSLGRAYLLEALTPPLIPPQGGKKSVVPQGGKGAGFPLRRGIKGDVLFLAADYLNQAVDGLRLSGNQDDVPRGLFARAFYYRIQNQFPEAWEDLAEAQEIAERGEMKLWLVDYHLEACRLSLAEGRPENGDRRPGKAKQHLEEAGKFVEETGYHRRDPEVELCWAGVFLAEGKKTKAREFLDKAKKTLDKMGIRMWDWEVRRLEDGLSG